MDLTTAILLIVLWLVSISWMSEWMNKWLKYFLNGTVSYHLFSQIISTKFSLNKMGFFCPTRDYNIIYSSLKNHALVCHKALKLKADQQKLPVVVLLEEYDILSKVCMWPKTGVSKPQTMDWYSSLWPVGTWLHKTAGGEWQASEEASSIFIAASHCSHYCLSSASHQISNSIQFS